MRSECLRVPSNCDKVELHYAPLRKSVCPHCPVFEFILGVESGVLVRERLPCKATSTPTFLLSLVRPPRVDRADRLAHGHVRAHHAVAHLVGAAVLGVVVLHPRGDEVVVARGGLEHPSRLLRRVAAPLLLGHRRVPRPTVHHRHAKRRQRPAGRRKLRGRRAVGRGVELQQGGAEQAGPCRVDDVDVRDACREESGGESSTLGRPEAGCWGHGKL